MLVVGFAGWDLGGAPDTTNARHHDLEDATVDLTSYRSDLVSLPENLCECPMINEIIDAEARVAREGPSRAHVM